MEFNKIVVPSKSSPVIADRVILSLRNMMMMKYIDQGNNDWINVLEHFVQIYNTREHRTIGMSPLKARIPRKFHEKIRNRTINFIPMTSIRIDSNGMTRNETNFEFIYSSPIFIDKIDRNFKFQNGESVKIIEKASNMFQHRFKPKVSRQKYLINRK